jgi:V8-like Glu-specific endopeptidase
MIEIKSISKSEQEEVDVVAERQLMEGRAGEPAETTSRSAKYLLVKGKTEEPLRRGVLGRSALIPESVILEDERERIYDTDLPPWRMICSLRMQGQAGGAIGTGWLAGPRTVITAGHCVFSKFFFGGWAEEIEIIPGRNENDTPFGRFTSRRFSSLDRWVNGEDADFDIGCIHLDRPVGETVGWFAVGALPASELESFQVNISGYPSDQGAGRQQWFHRNRILRVTERRIFYDVDTYGGQSGAPVWIYETEGSDPVVVGVHAYGVGSTPTSLDIVANSAPRIIPEVLQQIQTWVRGVA